MSSSKIDVECWDVDEGDGLEILWMQKKNDDDDYLRADCYESHVNDSFRRNLQPPREWWTVERKAQAPQSDVPAEERGFQFR